MIVSPICPFISAIRQNPNFIKTTSRTSKEIGTQASKERAWWHDGYKEAKKIEDSIYNGTYNPTNQPKLYNDNGYLNLNYFHSNDEGII